MKAPNEKILKYNDMKKWDVCLMNPPYGENSKGSNKFLHLDFTTKCLSLCDIVVSVMPHKIITTQNTDKFDKYKKIFDKSIMSIEEIDGKKFFKGEISTYELGIFTFDKNNKISNNIDIITLTKKCNISSLFDNNSIYNDTYELELLTYLHTNNPNYHIFRAYGDDKRIKEKQIIFVNNFVNKLQTGYYLITNAANGSRDAKYFSGKIGMIFNDKISLSNFIIKQNAPTYNVMIFDTEECAKNCKYALLRPVLRFVLAKLQNAQSITERIYQYVPNIDWSNEKVLTDEGLLEVCGCPKDKCKEYAEYCRKYMEEFDKQHQSKNKKKK